MAAKRPDSGSLFRRRLLWIALAAFLLRLGVSAELGAINGGRNSVFEPSTLTDLATYMNLAREILQGGFSGPFYYQPWYYAVFLPGCYLVSGGAIWFVVGVQALLGAAAAGLAGASAALLAGKRAGYAAAILAAISTPLLLYTPYHQNETLQSFHLALLLWLCLAGMRRFTLIHWGAAGLVTGIAILTRGNIQLLVPGIVLLLILAGVRKRVPLRRLAAALLLYGGLLFAIQLPFIIHNSRTLGRLSGPSTAADAVLALGNSQEAPAGGRDPGLPAGPMEYPQAYDEMMKRAEKGDSVPRQMGEWLQKSPGSFLELQFRKLLLFWEYREIPNNVSLYGEGEHSVILRALLPGRSVVLLTLGVAGLLVFARRLRRFGPLWMLYWFIFAYWGTIALFYNLSRFRAPILPAVAVAGGCYLAWLWRCRLRSGEKRRRALLAGTAAGLAALWFVTSSYDFYRRNLEAPMMRLVRPDGTRLDLLQGGSVLFDYGPFTFGGWSELEMRPGLRFSKRFSAAAPQGTLEWSILTEQPGRLRFRVNGKVVEENAAAPGVVKLHFPVTAPEGQLEFELLSVGGKHYLLYDAQRDYGRSGADGRPLPGEWLMRLEFP